MEQDGTPQKHPKGDQIVISGRLEDMLHIAAEVGGEVMPIRDMGMAVSACNAVQGPGVCRTRAA